MQQVKAAQMRLKDQGATTLSASATAIVGTASSSLVGPGCSAPNTPAGCGTATKVWGQAGLFTTNNPTTATTGLQGATATIVDSSGNRYVADANNNRILYYPAGTGCTAPNTPAGCGTATAVYGQAGLFTTRTSAHTATTLLTPLRIALDSSGNLYVVDNNNNRILYYPANSGCTAPNTPAECAGPQPRCTARLTFYHEHQRTHGHHADRPTGHRPRQQQQPLRRRH